MGVETDIKVPDIGGTTNVEVIELLVKEGDVISVDTPLVTLESDKASMEIPSPSAGVVRALKVALGDKVSEGDVILWLDSASDTAAPAIETEPSMPEPALTQQDIAPEPMRSILVSAEPVPAAPALSHSALISAGPAARRLAHVLGVDLSAVTGSARNARITKEDVEQFVKAALRASSTGHSGVAVSAAPVIDFSKFGEIEVKPLNKIKRLTGANVHRAWVTIPHVTQFDEADITDLEAFRQSEAQRTQADGYKLTLLAFVCKVVSKALTAFPQFNASLDATADHLIYKRYCNIGIAVETPNGLVVPVIKDVHRLSVSDIAREMARLSVKARDKGLMPADMSGGCFTISSLGGIGGTAFTPIVNSPEVAILGLSRASMKPVYDGTGFVPRLMLPLSLSYDHRVVDGAEAARFVRFIGEALNDIRRILL
jgi:pyruvate dehydrogenase E2 component (dihydrolipoamide acetyltransferase)